MTEEFNSETVTVSFTSKNPTLILNIKIKPLLQPCESLNRKPNHKMVQEYLTHKDFQ